MLMFQSPSYSTDLARLYIVTGIAVLLSKCHVQAFVAAMPTYSEHIINAKKRVPKPKYINSRQPHAVQTKLFPLNDVMTSKVASKLYPASMIGTLGELYFRTRREMGCPRGAVSSLSNNFLICMR
jgi:hypothetical protein